MEIINCKNVSETTVLATKELTGILKEFIAPPVLLMLSGGTALELLQGIDPSVVVPNITITVVDERYSEAENINTFSQLMASDFYRLAQEKGANFIRTKVLPGESLEKFTERYNNGLKSWRHNNQNGKVVVTLGMGDDGHTAGILPYPEDTVKFKELFEGSEDWVVGFETSPEKNLYTKRATATCPFLREMVDNAIVYVTGEKKKDALELALKPGSLSDIPARIWQEMKAVKIFTDIQL